MSQLYRRAICILMLTSSASVMAAQPACDCQPLRNMCGPKELAAEKSAEKTQWAQIVSSARLGAVNKLDADAIPDAADTKIAYQLLRRRAGEQRLASYVEAPLSSVGPANFEDPRFRVKVVSLLERLPVLKLHVDPNLVLPGTPAGGVVIPRTPARIVTANGSSCWTTLANPFEVKSGSQQMTGAFGLDFPEVGRIVRVASAAGTAGGFDLDGVCGFTALSPSWVLTALHCVADQAAEGSPWARGVLAGSEMPKKWQGERILFLGQSAPLMSFPNACFDKDASGSCPWTRLHVEQVFTLGLEADPNAPRMPANDIALIRLGKPIGPDIDYPVFASTSTSGTSTLVAFGKVAPPFWEFFHLQVGWNRSGTGNATTNKFTWNPAQNTGQTTVCPGDSGGAIFQGYENGGCECQKGKRLATKRRLAGLVSFVSMPGNFSSLQPPAKLSACATSNYAGAVMPSGHKAWICGLAPEARACQ